MDSFQLAAGSVIGTDHRADLGEKNGQDACLVRRLARGATLCLVTDGCSTVLADGRAAPSRNEVGAQIGARLLAEAVARRLDVPDEISTGPFDEASASAFLERVRTDVLERLDALVSQLGPSRSGIVGEYFLFTVVGLLDCGRGTVTFSIGDGIIAVNGETTVLGPFPGNQPPYLAYGLVETSLKANDPDALRFRIHHVLSPGDLDSFLIGCDGVLDLIRAEDRTLPGRLDRVGPLSQFWTDDAYFANPDAVRRRLALMNRTVVRPDWERKRLERESGLLPDDTTLISGRRRRSGGAT